MSKYNYNTLCHHGIKGQKWGIRRFQNEDGTLTAEGRKRYDVDSNGQMSKEGKKVYNMDLKMNKKANEKHYVPKTPFLAVLGMTIGAAEGYVQGKMQFPEDKAAGDLVGGLGAIVGGITGGIGGAIGGSIYDSRNKSRVENAKKYIDSLR